MSLPLIPFAKLPYKEWNDETEKKPRLEKVEHENEVFYIQKQDDQNSLEKKLKERKRGKPKRFKRVIEDESEESDQSDSSSGDSSEYDLIQHIKDLLPGETGQNGEKPTKQANSLHLEELRAVKKPTNYFAVFHRVGKYIEDVKARERERRKHHLLRHFEEKVKEYDELQRQKIQEALEKKQKDKLLEEYHRQQRIARNSKKKVEKKLLAEQFTNDLSKREKETNQMMFYSENFSKWRIEEMNKIDEENERQRILAIERAKQKELDDEKDRRKKLIEDDWKLLKEDEKITSDIEKMMLRSGIIFYQKPRERLSYLNHEQELLNDLFEKNKKMIQNQANLKVKKEALMNYYREQQERNILITSLELILDEESYQEEELFTLAKEIKKNRFKRNMKMNGYFCPFNILLSEINTNDIVKVKGIGWKEVGIYSFCYEMTQNGNFSMIKQLDLTNCCIRNNGVITLFYHLKINNIFNLTELNLSHNFLSFDLPLKKSFTEIGALNLLQNLVKLNLSKNELKDAGMEIIIQLIIQKYILNIEEIFLSFNSITNNGFRAIMKILIPLQESCVPHLKRCALENNLVDSNARSEFFPLPSFISV